MELNGRKNIKMFELKKIFFEFSSISQDQNIKRLVAVFSSHLTAK